MQFTQFLIFTNAKKVTSGKEEVPTGDFSVDFRIATKCNNIIFCNSKNYILNYF